MLSTVPTLSDFVNNLAHELNQPWPHPVTLPHGNTTTQTALNFARESDTITVTNEKGTGHTLASINFFTAANTVTISVTREGFGTVEATQFVEKASRPAYASASFRNASELFRAAILVSNEWGTGK